VRVRSAPADREIIGIAVGAGDERGGQLVSARILRECERIGAILGIFDSHTTYDAQRDFHFDPQTNIVETHISRLRAKLNEAAGSHDAIETVRGIGYRMNRDA
jgi:hypothetical protein